MKIPYGARPHEQPQERMVIFYDDSTMLHKREYLTDSQSYYSSK